MGNKKTHTSDDVANAWNQGYAKGKAETAKTVEEIVVKKAVELFGDPNERAFTVIGGHQFGPTFQVTLQECCDEHYVLTVVVEDRGSTISRSGAIDKDRLIGWIDKTLEVQ